MTTTHGIGRGPGGCASAAFALVWLLLSGCAGPGPLDAEMGGSGAAACEPGLPNFDLDAGGSRAGGAPALAVALAIAPSELSFVGDGSGVQAVFRTTVEIRDAAGRVVLAAPAEADTLRLTSADSLIAPLVREAVFPLPPGPYLVVATVVDARTGRSAERRRVAEVPDPAGAPALGPVRLTLERSGPLPEPLVGFGAPAGFSGIGAEVEAWSAPPGTVVTFRLERLRRDTASAQPPFWLAPGPTSLDAGTPSPGGAPVDTLAVVEQVLDAPGVISEVTVSVVTVSGATASGVTADLPGVGEGLYRVTAEARVPAEGAPFAVRSRRFAVRPPAYPHPATADDLIAPLVYVAAPRDLGVLRSGATADERRRLFDAYWASLRRRATEATAAARLFYARVEQANVLFGAEKEGWKTDRGMVYVVFGPPRYVERAVGLETWHYRPADAPAPFVFERAGTDGGWAGLEVWLLRRSPVYEEPWRAAVRRWRTGGGR